LSKKTYDKYFCSWLKKKTFVSGKKKFFHSVKIEFSRKKVFLF
jgi:hypothetical protein